MSLQTDDFINKYADAVIAATQGTGIFPSVAMAQMILESSWGTGITATQANNFFGIKADSSWTGPTMSFPTPNDPNPVSSFRVYATPEDSIKDHDAFLQQNSRYNNIYSAASPEEQATDIANDGYADASNYAQTLISLINQYNLSTLDDQTIIQQKKINGVAFIIIVGFVMFVIFNNLLHPKYKVLILALFVGFAFVLWKYTPIGDFLEI